VAGDPDLVHFQRVASHADFRDVREISAVRVLECHAHAGPGGELARAPGRLLAHELQYAGGARRIEPIAVLLSLLARAGQQGESEVDRILSRGLRELVDERLEDPRKRVTARRAHRVGGHAKGHEAGAERKVVDEARGELAPGNAGRRSELLSFAVADEVVAPRDEIA